MLLLKSSRTGPNPEDCRLPVPKLERGQRGYHHDLIAAVAKHFGRDRIDIEALDQILSPSRSGEILAAAHAIAGRSVLALDTTIVSATQETQRWYTELRRAGANSQQLQEIRDRTQSLFTHGKQIRIDFYDKSMTNEEMQELIRQHHLGLVSLDWGLITKDQQFREQTTLITPSHGFPDIRLGTEPLYYQVVPLVGYTKNGASMLVHTHLFPFVEIDSQLFAAARQSVRAEKTIVFFSSQPTKAQQAAPEYSWVLPGAFKGTLLIRPEEVAPVPPISQEDLNRAMNLALATGKASHNYFQVPFRYFLKAASLMLAKNDHTGEDIRDLEEHIIQAAKTAPVRDQFQGFTAHDWLTSGLEGGVSNRTEVNKQLKDQERYLREEADEREGEAQSTEQSSALIASSPLTGTREAILEYFKDLSTRAFQRDDSVTEELIAVTRHCMQSVQQYELGSSLVESLSTSQRIIGQIYRFKRLDDTLAKKHLYATIHNSSYEHALKPRILLAAGARVDDEEMTHNYTPGCDADEHALNRHDILGVTGDGLSLHSYWFHAGLGTLRSATSTNIKGAIFSALRIATDKEELDDGMKASDLINIISRIPLTDDQISKLNEVLDPKLDELATYLSSPNNWVTSQLMATKPWLEIAAQQRQGYNEVIQYLNDMLEILKSGASSDKNIEYNPRIAPIAQSSLLANTEVEQILLQFLETSVTERTALNEVVLHTVGGEPAAQALRKLTSNESLIYKPERYFRSNSDGSLQLEKAGVDYLLKLIDPEYPYFHTFQDSREFEQWRHERRSKGL